MKDTAYKNPRLWLWWAVSLVVHGLLAWVILSQPADMFALAAGSMDAKTIFTTLVIASSAALWLQSLRLAQRRPYQERIAVVKRDFPGWLDHL